MRLIKYVVSMIVACAFFLGIMNLPTLQAAQDEVVIPIIASSVKQSKDGKAEGGCVGQFEISGPEDKSVYTVVK